MGTGCANVGCIYLIIDTFQWLTRVTTVVKLLVILNNRSFDQINSCQLPQKEFATSS
jgi:hypothetical protein